MIGIGINMWHQRFQQGTLLNQIWGLTTDSEDGSLLFITTDIEDGALENILIDTEDR